MKKIRLTKEIKIKMIISICLIGLLFLSFFFSDKLEDFLNLKQKYNENQKAESCVYGSDYYVSYINVGQGNSCFIKLPDGKCALIDGGDIEYGKTVADFVTDKGYSTIDYMIATHADSDHIGGLNYILDNFEVKNIYRPFQISGTGTSAETFVASEYEDLSSVYTALNSDGRSKIARVTTEVYKTFIENIYTETYLENETSKQSEICVFYDGLKISGENYEFEFFGPTKRTVSDDVYDLSIHTDNTAGFATVGYGVSEINGGSAIFTFTCQQNKFLFTGDAPFSGSGSSFEELDFINSLTDAEKEVLLKTTVLILGHHGSKYSTSEDLLNLVNPDYIVISSGNMYGHPAEETLERITKTLSFDDENLLRTDTSGTISFSKIDGEFVYSIEKMDSYVISYKMLATIIVLFIIIIIFSIKFKARTKVKFIDRRKK